MLSIRRRNKRLKSRGKKVCGGCKRTKVFSDFYPRKEGGYACYCKGCNKVRSRNFYRKKEKICDNCSEKVNNLAKKGMTLSTSSSMVSSFDGVELCVICGKELEK